MLEELKSTEDSLQEDISRMQEAIQEKESLAADLRGKMADIQKCQAIAQQALLAQGVVPPPEYWKSKDLSDPPARIQSWFIKQAVRKTIPVSTTHHQDPKCSQVINVNVLRAERIENASLWK